MSKSSIELWLVRHGETTANAANQLSGWSDVSLTPRGEEQARALFGVLSRERFDGIWSSDLCRALATAKLATGIDAPTLRVDPQLREMHFGAMEGREWHDVPESLRDDLLEFKKFEAPGGEELEEFKGRIRGFVDGLGPGRHLLFTHGGVIRVLTMDLGEDRFVRNGALCVVDWTERRIVSVTG